MSAATLTCVSDGFMLNLGAVLLQLCQPFCTSAEDPKALKIDPTYGAVPVSLHYFGVVVLLVAFLAINWYQVE